MGNSIPRFTTTCHNKRSNSLSTLLPPTQTLSLIIITASAYESGKKTYLDFYSANSCVIIASIWVDVYWFEATSVAILITLLAGMLVIGCYRLKAGRTFDDTRSVFCYPLHKDRHIVLLI